MWALLFSTLVVAASAYQNQNQYHGYPREQYAQPQQNSVNTKYQAYPQQYQAPAPSTYQQPATQQQQAPAPAYQALAPANQAPAPAYQEQPAYQAPAPQYQDQYGSYQAPSYQQQPQQPQQPQQGYPQAGTDGYYRSGYSNYDYDYGYSGMQSAARSSYKPTHKPATKFVPVVVKNKKKSKKLIISTNHGFYIPGGTQMFGKFADLHSCQKACELTPTCFAGDFNPWVKKCFMHNNLTACQVMKTNKQITHFKKVPCTVVDTPRGLVTLGTQIFKGIEMKGIKSLTECIKKCANLGGGIAPIQTDASVASTPQLCHGLDYDFSNHKCYVHTDATLCTNVATILTPKQLVKNPSSVNILLCALTMSGK